jgi:murein DD-endopeptidase MepM/ murein hydrolase activator NlpD
MLIHRYAKSPTKNFRQGFTFLIIPNSAGGKVTTWPIPFLAALVIIGFIIFNIYTFIAYTTQIGQIKKFRQDIAEKKQLIVKLRAEQSRITPVLEKNRRIGAELNLLKQEQASLHDLWKRIQIKGRYRLTLASRGGWNTVKPYLLNSPPKTDNLFASLDELNTNLTHLDNFLEEERQAQKQLIRDLAAYEIRLDHTPSIWPVRSTIVSPFGSRFHPVWGNYRQHTGVDLRAASGTKVFAAADGVICFNGRQHGYGKLIQIDHGYGYKTYYAHNSRLLVAKGKKVKKGQLIAISGNTGITTGPHLHYEVRVNDEPVNPVSFLHN